MNRKYTITFFILLFMFVHYLSLNQSLCTNSNRIVTNDHIDIWHKHIDHSHEEESSQQIICQNPSHDCCGEHIPVTSVLTVSKTSSLTPDFTKLFVSHITDLLPVITEVPAYNLIIRNMVLNDDEPPDDTVKQLSSTIILC